MRSTSKLAALLTAVGLILAGCGGDGDAGGSQGPDPAGWHDQIEGGPLEAGVLSAEGTPGLKIFEDLAGQLEADHQGTEVTLTFANTEARPALEQRWRSGDPPDVDYGMFDGTRSDLLAWADDGFLLDLRPYLEQKDSETGQPWLGRFDPNVMKWMEHPTDHGIYAVPSELSVHVLFYNAKLLKDSGVQPPETWEEFLAAADGLKTAGVDPIAVTGLFEPYMGMWTDHLWLRTVGYDKTRAVLADGKGRITADPGFLQGLEMLQDLRDRDAFLEGFQGTDFTAAQAQFFQGKAGFILMGSWLVSEMADSIPPGFEIGVLPFPSVDGAAGDQDAVMAALQQVSVAADSEHTPLALEWVRRLTSTEVQTRRADEIGEVSAVKDVPSPPGIPGIDTLIADAGQLQPRHYGIDQSPVADVVYPEVARLLFGKQDAKQTLDRLDQGLRRVHGN